MLCTLCPRDATAEVWKRGTDGYYRKEPRCGAHLPPEPKPEPAWMSDQSGRYDSIHHNDRKYAQAFPVGEYTIISGGKPK